MKPKVRPPSCIYKIGTSYTQWNFMINLHERMLPTSAGVEPATSWSPVGRASNCATEAGVSGLNKFPLVPCNDKSFYHMSLGSIVRVIQMKLQRMVSRFDRSGFKSYKTTKIGLSSSCHSSSFNVLF